MNQCMVCIETFSKVKSRSQAKCPYCDIKVCVGCTQTYLLGTHEDAHCMNCKKAWSREVLDEMLLLTWLNGEYKKHRETVLLDRERSRLPAAQLILERQKEAVERKPKLKELEEVVLQCLKVYQDARAIYDTEANAIARLERGEPAGHTQLAKEKEEARAFIMPCPADGCRGFLSTAYKCGICDKYTCPECREVKGAKDAEHTCNPQTVESVRALKKECKPCPECGANIYKILGCDQMFCTACKTPFSWKTGKKIVGGALHNPHYFDYLRTLNGGVAPRNAGDIPCDNMIGPNALYYLGYLEIKNEPLLKTIRTIVRLIQHIRWVEIPKVTVGAEDLDNTDMNIRFLKNEITEKHWREVLQNREKRRARKQEIRQRLEALVGATSDVFSRFPSQEQLNEFRDMKKERDSELMKVSTKSLTAWQKKMDAKAKEVEAILAEIVEQFEKVRQIFNPTMLAVSKRYNVLVPSVCEKYDIKMVKAPKKTSVDRKKKTAESTVQKTEAELEQEDRSWETSDEEP